MVENIYVYVYIYIYIVCVCIFTATWTQCLGQACACRHCWFCGIFFLAHNIPENMKGRVKTLYSKAPYGTNRKNDASSEQREKWTLFILFPGSMWTGLEDLISFLAGSLKFLVCFSRHISVCHRIVFLYILFTFIDIYVFSYGGNINDSNIIRRDVSRLFCYYKLFILSVMWSRIVLFESGLGLVINVNCKPLKK